MSRWKQAAELIELMDLLGGSYAGLGYSDIQDHFSCSRSTAKRMMKAVEAYAGHFLSDPVIGADNVRRWRLQNHSFTYFSPPRQRHLSALAQASQFLREHDRDDSARVLEGLAAKLLYGMKQQAQRSAEIDVDAGLESEGFISRPKVREKIPAEKISVLRQAFEEYRCIRARYTKAVTGEPSDLVLEPLGILTGPPHYLVARHRGEDKVKTFKIRGLDNITLTDLVYDRQDFDLRAYAGRSFGIYQEDQIYKNVWRVRPDAVGDVQAVLFHPGQKFEKQPDGSLHIVFEACGWMEMCWHVMRWRGKIEILEPVWVREKYRSMLKELTDGL